MRLKGWVQTKGGSFIRKGDGNKSKIKVEPNGVYSVLLKDPEGITLHREGGAVGGPAKFLLHMLDLLSKAKGFEIDGGTWVKDADTSTIPLMSEAPDVEV